MLMIKHIIFCATNLLLHGCSTQLKATWNLVYPLQHFFRMTPLHYAARYGHAHALEVLLKLGAQVNVAQRYGWRPVHECAMYGRTECLDLLLRCGSHINAKTGKTTKGNTPLHYAAKYGHLETAQVLLNAT